MASGEASKKSGKMMSTTSFDDLPSENAVEILLRLPVKSLMSSTSVSKTWYSLIVNPNFISQQFTRAISSRVYENTVLIVHYHCRIEKYCYLLSADTGCVLDKFECPFDKWDTWRLVGSVHGILCLSYRIYFRFEEGETLYLWNPSVREFRFVAFSSLKDHFHNCPKSFNVVGFGFHQPTRDYRVVRIVYAGNPSKVKYVPRVEIFSLRMNDWREIQNPLVLKVSATHFGTTVENCVYWADTKKTYGYFGQVWIVSFDFNNEVFGQVKLPDDVRYCVGNIAYFQLMKFESSLAVCVSNSITTSNLMPIQPCCIWLMSHEDGIVSWTLRFKFVLKEHVRPLNITRSGTLLMRSVSRPRSVLLSCNLKSKQFLQLVELLGNSACAVDTSFIDSLLLLEGREELLKSTN